VVTAVGVCLRIAIAAHTVPKERNVLKLTLSIASLCLVLTLPLFRVQAQTAEPQTTDQATADTSQRTVMGTEFGSIFAKPNGCPYSDFGVYIGASYYSSNLNPDAIKAKYSQFHIFAPTDSGIGFPYTALRQYDAQQVAAGKPSVFVTATYQGKRRPVMYFRSLGLSGNRPTTSPQSWKYVVNVRDPRFINFWITKYARPVVVEPMAHLGSPYVYVDGVTVLYSAYGVLDNSNHFVPGVKWDEPYPQSGNDFQAAMATFFAAVTQQAPDIKILVDTGALSDSGGYQTLYANVTGMLTENVYGWAPNPDTYVVNQWYSTIFPWFAWAGATGKVNVMGAFLPSNYENGPLRDSFIVYELLKGANSFFAPRVGGTALPLSAPWLGWNAKLGSPLAPFQSTQLGSAAGNRLFSRQYTNGYVYLNWTGSTRTVKLPAGTTWYDPNGNVVTSLSIPTWTGSFVNQ